MERKGEIRKQRKLIRAYLRRFGTSDYVFHNPNVTPSHLYLFHSREWYRFAANNNFTLDTLFQIMTTEIHSARFVKLFVMNRNIADGFTGERNRTAIWIETHITPLFSRQSTVHDDLIIYQLTINEGVPLQYFNTSIRAFFLHRNLSHHSQLTIQFVMDHLYECRDSDANTIEKRELTLDNLISGTDDNYFHVFDWDWSTVFSNPNISFDDYITFITAYPFFGYHAPPQPQPHARVRGVDMDIIDSSIRWGLTENPNTTLRALLYDAEQHPNVNQRFYLALTYWKNPNVTREALDILLLGLDEHRADIQRDNWLIYNVQSPGDVVRNINVALDTRRRVTTRTIDGVEKRGFEWEGDALKYKPKNLNFTIEEQILGLQRPNPSFETMRKIIRLYPHIEHLGKTDYAIRLANENKIRNTIVINSFISFNDLKKYLNTFVSKKIIGMNELYIHTPLSTRIIIHPPPISILPPPHHNPPQWGQDDYLDQIEEEDQLMGYNQIGDDALDDDALL